MAKILVVAPHPDDEVIGCGGSVVKHARAGHEITLVTVGARMSSHIEQGLTPADYQNEEAAAQRALGIGKCIALGFPGRTLAFDPELIIRLARAFRAECPEIVYIPHENEGDLDHRRTCEAALEALWISQSVYFDDHGPRAGAPRLVLGYEVWTPIQRYQYVEDISGEIDAKVEAMRRYRSQLRHSPWDNAVRGLASYRGVTAQGGGFAEVFSVLSLAGPLPARDERPART
jgi:LmbE family N-acetylglucosaminyl deacetylase